MAESGKTKGKTMKKSRSGCKLIIKRVNNRITSYFPPSPAPDDESSDFEEDTLTSGLIPDLGAGEPVKEHEDADDSTIPTPESTPTKDKNGTPNVSITHSPHTITLIEDPTSDDTDESKENRITNNSKQIHSTENDSRLCESPRPTKAKQIKSSPVTPVKETTRGRGRAGRGRSKKSAKSTTTAASKAKQSTTTNTTSDVKSAPKNPSVQQNHLLTDFFPIRRSSRQTSTDLKKQRQLDLEKAIREECIDGLEVVDIPGKGRGIVATKVFKKGDFVVEYLGDLISVAKAKDREKKYQANPDFGCYMYYFNFNNSSYCIDATAESGKLGRLLNHSCKTPNCSTKVVSVDDRPHLILVANRDITINEELIYDYGDRSKESLAAHPWLAL